MNLPVRLNDNTKEARVRYITEADFTFIKQWQKSLGTDADPIRVDAVDFANLACARFTAHAPIEIYAQQASDINRCIENDPNCEVANLVALTCDWFPESNIIGLIHFRRTWSNNLVLDYLAVHPLVARPPREYSLIVRGVGTALLFFLCSVAQECDCGCIWGEATLNSCSFYQKVFELDLVTDLLYIPQEKFIRFVTSLEDKWQRSRP
jgi:hypothetical protein